MSSERILRNNLSYRIEHICVKVFITVLFIMEKRGKEFKCPAAGKELAQLWFTPPDKGVLSGVSEPLKS